MHVSSGQRFTSRARSPSQRQEGVRLDRCGARVTPPQPWRRQFDSHLPLTPRRQGRLLDGGHPVWRNPLATPRALSLSIAVAFHKAVPGRPTSRDHALRLTLRKDVASRRTRRERARRVRPIVGFRHFQSFKFSTSNSRDTRYGAHDRAQTCWSTSSKPGELPLGEPRTAPQLRPQVAYLLDAPFLFALEAVSVVLGGGQVLRGHRHSLCVRANL